MAKTKKKTKKRFEEKEIKRGEKRKANRGKERRDTTVVQYIRERINIENNRCGRQGFPSRAAPANGGDGVRGPGRSVPQRVDSARLGPKFWIGGPAMDVRVHS